MMRSIAARRGAGTTRGVARTLLLAPLALLAVAWLGPGSAHAAFPGENGRLAFTKGEVRGDRFSADVWVVNPDGGDKTRLTCGGRRASNPAWSPGGGRIAFGRGVPPEVDLWAMNANGGGQTRLTDRGRGPVWSPDGQRIAFEKLSVAAKELFVGNGVINADGVGEVVFGDGGQPAWSPDSRRIAVGGLELWNADGTAPTFLAPGGSPAWSPDGERIAFVRDGEIWAVNPDGSEEAQLTDAADHQPSWSPDGERIGFVRGTYPRTDVWVMNADGTAQRRLTTGGEVTSFTWSPDGQRIAFARDDVWVMNADGSDKANLTDSPTLDRNPDWQALPASVSIGPPPSHFCFGPQSRNTKRGIARLVVRVPRPGRVVLRRRPGVKRFAQAHRTAGPGRVVMRIRPRGWARRLLSRAGRTLHRVQLPVRARVTYRPWIGEPWTKGRRVWLVRTDQR
jgi:dipeptidyl aminopeptidase/acylaminoacyl peptidase